MLLLRLHRLGFLHVLILFLSMTSKKIHFLFTFLKFGVFFVVVFGISGLYSLVAGEEVGQRDQGKTFRLPPSHMTPQQLRFRSALIILVLELPTVALTT